MILLDDTTPFPNPHQYHPLEGLMAVGGDLTSSRLLEAYTLGIFPWHHPDEDILWWCPDPRFVLFPNELKISKSMQTILKRKKFRFTENKCFEEVMFNCQKIPRKGQDGTWISDTLIEGFCELHHQGFAKSIEVWEEGKLVGGFYGMEIGNVFCGESMFSKVSNASKAGFIDFIIRNKDQYTLIDCQVHSKHLEHLGACLISKAEFLSYLHDAPQ